MKGKRTCLLSNNDTSLRTDRDVKEKGEKWAVLKYKDRMTVKQRMRNTKTNERPIVIGATRSLSRSFQTFR
jgi:hypothetical protein